MSNQTTSERMTRERMNELAFTVDSSSYLDIELPDDQTHEAVLLVDALAYGADERAAAMLEAAKAMCELCAADDCAVAERNYANEWRHNGVLCHAGPIHDAIQAMRGKSTNATT